MQDARFWRLKCRKHDIAVGGRFLKLVANHTSITHLPKEGLTHLGLAYDAPPRVKGTR
jgi:hypothetical protein